MLESQSRGSRCCHSLLILVVFLLQTGCGERIGIAIEDTPERTVAWGGIGRGWGPWGSSGSYMYAASVEPVELDIWQWAGDTMKQRCCAPSREHILSIAILSHDGWIARVLDPTDKEAYFFVGEMRSGEASAGRLAPRDKWPQPRDWYIKIGRGSGDGKFVAAWRQPELPPDGTSDYPVDFGFVLPREKRFEWVAKGGMQSPSSMIEDIVPSDDGAHLAVGGWKNGVAMIDVAKKKVAWLASQEYKPGEKTDIPISEVPWKALPLDEVNTNDLAFSPDSNLVYSVGDRGCVFGIRVETGEIVSQWWVTPKRQHGDRPVVLSASPDGRFVAVGTGPSGHVYLFTTKDGERRILNHGSSTILMLSFSPDSKRLATYAAGKIKIWKLVGK